MNNLVPPSVVNEENNSSEYYIDKNVRCSVSDTSYDIWMCTNFSFRIKKDRYVRDDNEKLMAILCKLMMDRIKETCEESVNEATI